MPDTTAPPEYRDVIYCYIYIMLYVSPWTSFSQPPVAVTCLWAPGRGLITAPWDGDQRPQGLGGETDMFVCPPGFAPDAERLKVGALSWRVLRV